MAVTTKLRRRLKLVAFVVLAGWLALFSASEAAVAFLRGTAPVQALALDGNDARAAANLFEQRLAAGRGTKRLAPKGRQQLLASLRSNPLSRKALRVLAYDSDIGGDRTAARKFMTLSARVSRRDFPAQVWLIQDSGRQKDFVAIINHYDAALSTQSQSYAFLFPPMTAGLDFPQFRRAMVPLIKADRRWVPSYISHIISNAPRTQPVAALIAEATPFKGSAQLDSMLTNIIDRYVAEGAAEAAQDFAIKVLGAAPDQFSVAGFTGPTTDPRFAPMTWSLTADSAVEADLMEDGGVEVHAASDDWMLAASRIFAARPGTYHFKQTVSYPQGQPAAVSRWEGYCLNGTGQGRIWLHDTPVSDGVTASEADLALPAGCTGLRLEFYARGNGHSEDAVINLRDISIARK